MLSGHAGTAAQHAMAGSEGATPMEQDAAFHGYEPLRVVDDVINSFNDYACDAADAMQKVLVQEPALREHGKSIEEGLDRWQLKVQRAADKNFDKFELYALNNVFRVPAELTQAPVEGVDESAVDEQLEGLWAQLRQELATKAELQQRVAAAGREVQRWEAHRHVVEELCSARRSEALERVLHEARQLDAELRRGREQLQGSGSADGSAPSFQQAISERRIQISTAGLSDLKVLGSMLCA